MKTHKDCPILSGSLYFFMENKMIDIPFFYRYTDKSGRKKSALIIKRLDLASFFYILIDPKTGKEFNV